MIQKIFLESADVYFCDNCGRDITKHLHRGRAHVRQPLGPVWYVCVCGKSYLSGATEWDYLSQWDKHQWRTDVGFTVFLFVLLLIPVGLGYAAWHLQSGILLAIFVVVLIPAFVLLMLFGIMLRGFMDIARSIRRTRVTPSS
ncbi:MAG TPA: hypothetical protein VGK24_22355 [Candidatus Angelobacter sp.]